MSKISPQDKIYYCQQYQNGKMSKRQIAKETGLATSSIHQWIKNYEAMGNKAFIPQENKHYSKELKLQAVKDFLAGIDSQYGICKRYGIKSKSQLQKWILQYNSHEELKSSGTGGNIVMTKGRKTTFDERIEIVQYCIAHDHNYAEASKEYQVSYQQARNYTIKYESKGIDALKDNRGKRKNPNEMSELERLRAENKILKAEKERAQMEISFLKKLEEIESELLPVK